MNTIFANPSYMLELISDLRANLNVQKPLLNYFVDITIGENLYQNTILAIVDATKATLVLM